MDTSKQTFSEANSTGLSMYLSFDSSISSAAYKTLEATTNDLSMLSNFDNEEETVENSQDMNQNSTLEALDSHLSYIESVKNMDTQFQLSAVPKRILQEFNVVSSTPTKEQLLRSVEVSRGSGAERCLDLKIAFTELDEKKIETATDKENESPRKEVEANSGIINQNVLMNEKATSIVTDKINFNKTEDVEETPKGNIEKPANGNNGQTTENTLENKAINKRLSIVKKPVCEPNLLTNRPSRIAVNSNKRFSTSNLKVKADIDKEVTEIPKLMNKVLKIAENTTAINNKTKASSILDKRKSIMYNTKGRSSMLPSSTTTQAEKRPFAFTQRMSVLVKTTLNSPARKIARRSVLPTTQPTRTVPLKPSRISMLPTGRAAPSTTATITTKSTIKPLIESNKQTTTNRKSIYSFEKLPKTNTVTTVNTQNSVKSRQSTAAKLESSFTCNTCGCKFSIKSLLDAHKRSHEGDGLPAFVKKPTINAMSTAPTTTTQTNGTNKCKYCDKKFALVRALHIHLLQNCPKIPPSEKRKLKFHEMDHVEKPQLPAFFHANTSNNKMISNKTETPVQAKAVTSAQRSHSDLSSISISSTDSASDKKALAEITMIATNAAEMAPPSARIVKKTTAHAGIHRTPNKSIMCHTCKISFKCIMDHIQHNMTVHFKNFEMQKTLESDTQNTITKSVSSAAK